MQPIPLTKELTNGIVHALKEKRAWGPCEQCGGLKVGILDFLQPPARDLERRVTLADGRVVERNETAGYSVIVVCERCGYLRTYLYEYLVDMTRVEPERRIIGPGAFPTDGHRNGRG
jgi:hypothetical protein